MSDGLVLAFQKLLSYWDFPNLQSLQRTVGKKKKIQWATDLLAKIALLMSEEGEWQDCFRLIGEQLNNQGMKKIISKCTTTLNLETDGL